MSIGVGYRCMYLTCMAPFSAIHDAWIILSELHTMDCYISHKFHSLRCVSIMQFPRVNSVKNSMAQAVFHFTSFIPCVSLMNSLF